MIDYDFYYCLDDNCLICEKEMDVSVRDVFSRRYIYKTCINGCYALSREVENRNFSEEDYSVFNEVFRLTRYHNKTDEDMNRQYIGLRRMIEYWKENDRYIARIMEGK
jgi:hypothetical protein